MAKAKLSSKFVDLDNIAKNAKSIELCAIVLLKNGDTARLEIISSNHNFGRMCGAFLHLIDPKTGLRMNPTKATARAWHPSESKGKTVMDAAKALLRLAKTERLVAVEVKQSKSATKANDVKEILLQAWCETLDVPVPSVAELKQEKKQKAESLKELCNRKADEYNRLRQQALQGVCDGTAGVKQWNDFVRRSLVDDRDFQNTDFKSANLTKIFFEQCDLRNANFQEAVLDQAFCCLAQFENANFSSARLRQADLTESDLSNANFKNADLTKANLRGSHLQGADLRTAKVDGAQFECAEFDEKTRWPKGFVDSQGLLKWVGKGKNPFLK